jgi:hypothetical protein
LIADPAGSVYVLLQHYQEKLEQYEKEEKFLLDRIAHCSKLLDSSNRFESKSGTQVPVYSKYRFPSRRSFYWTG